MLFVNAPYANSRLEATARSLPPMHAMNLTCAKFKVETEIGLHAAGYAGRLAGR